MHLRAYLWVGLLASAISGCSDRPGSSIDTAIVINTHGMQRALEEGSWISKLYPGADTHNAKWIVHEEGRTRRTYDHFVFATPQGTRELYFDVSADDFWNTVKPANDPTGPVAFSDTKQRDPDRRPETSN
jgi:hypothetical protein